MDIIHCWPKKRGLTFTTQHLLWVPMVPLLGLILVMVIGSPKVVTLKRILCLLLLLFFSDY